MSKEKCRRAVQALRAGEGEFKAAERACEEARASGVPQPEVTAIWSEGLPGGLGAVPANKRFLSHAEARELLRALRTAGIRAPKVGWCVKAFGGEVCHYPPSKYHAGDSGYQTIHVTVPGSLGHVVPEERVSSFGATEEPPFGSHLGYRIATLDSYSTPYYYAVGPSPLGSRNHFQTIRQLKSYMNRLQKAGKLPVRDGGFGIHYDRRHPGPSAKNWDPVVENADDFGRKSLKGTMYTVWSSQLPGGLMQIRDFSEAHATAQRLRGRLEDPSGKVVVDFGISPGLGSAPLKHVEKRYGWLDSYKEALDSAHGSLATGHCSEALWAGLRAAAAVRAAVEHASAASNEVGADVERVEDVEDFFHLFTSKCVRRDAGVPAPL